MTRFRHYFATFEPARLRAVWGAVVALAAALGLTIPTGVDVRVTAVLAALVVLVPLVQGELTRAAVTPAATVVTAVDRDGDHVPGAAADLDPLDDDDAGPDTGYADASGPDDPELLERDLDGNAGPVPLPDPSQDPDADLAVDADARHDDGSYR